MGCLLALLAAISPRFVIFLLWIFTDRLTIAFRSGWEGVLGFLLLPYATLFYALVYAPGKGVDTFGWVIVAIGVLIDLSSLTFGSRARRRRARVEG
ncbi:MAG TPA: hypothetical protein VN820_02775 [Acidimicrobiales bacterium]|nr:hypothetical protein [Acidimicrobiales bacterium]